MNIIRNLLIILTVLGLASCGSQTKHKDTSGLFLVKQDGKYGYIDKTGKIVISPQFSYASDFSEGLATVSLPGVHLGYIDVTGKIVINPQYVYAGPFSDGLALVQPVGGGFGYIDKTGKFAHKQMFSDAKDFSEGLARAYWYGKYGFITKTGGFFIDPQFDRAEDFSEGMAAVFIGGINSETGGKCGYINNVGKYVCTDRGHG